MTKNDFTTKDLQDIDWEEQENGFPIYRDSMKWKDEYTLRMSGFSEAKSLAAMELDKKRNQLQGVRKNLKDQIIMLRKERKKFAVERTDLLQKQAQQRVKIKELDSKLMETEAALKEYQDEEAEAKAEAKAEAEAAPLGAAASAPVAAPKNAKAGGQNGI